MLSEGLSSVFSFFFRLTRRSFHLAFSREPRTDSVPFGAGVTSTLLKNFCQAFFSSLFTAFRVRFLFSENLLRFRSVEAVDISTRSRRLCQTLFLFSFAVPVTSYSILFSESLPGKFDVLARPARTIKPFAHGQEKTRLFFRSFLQAQTPCKNSYLQMQVANSGMASAAFCLRQVARFGAKAAFCAPRVDLAGFVHYKDTAF